MHIWKSFQYSVFLSHARKASVSTRSQQRNDNTDEKKTHDIGMMRLIQEGYNVKIR